MAFSYDNLKLDKGMYQEAGRSFSQVLERQEPPPISMAMPTSRNGRFR